MNLSLHVNVDARQVTHPIVVGSEAWPHERAITRCGSYAGRVSTGGA